MINYRVEALHELLALLRQEGCEVDSKVEESEYGKFGWVMDPEGNRIELWQPPEGR
jgi:hypothetical protein